MKSERRLKALSSLARLRQMEEQLASAGRLAAEHEHAEARSSSDRSKQRFDADCQSYSRLWREYGFSFPDAMTAIGASRDQFVDADNRCLERERMLYAAMTAHAEARKSTRLVEKYMSAVMCDLDQSRARIEAIEADEINLLMQERVA